MIKYYNIHDKIHMRVVNPTKIFDRLKMFECDYLEKLDIDVILGTLWPKLNEFSTENDGYYCTKTSLYKFYRHKISTWKIYIDNLTGTKTTILFDGDPFFSVELLLMLFLEPLFVYKMSKKNGLVLHSSAFSVKNNGFLFTGDTGIGKTSILLKMIRDLDAQYLADDQTFVHNKKILAYPVPIGFRAHLVEDNDVVVDNKKKTVLFLHKMINDLLNYYLNLTLRIFPEDVSFKNRNTITVGDTAKLKSIFILKLTEDEPNVQQISGQEAFPLILEANNKNEDKLKIFTKFLSYYKPDENLWTDFEANLHKLTDSEDVNFYLVNLNKKYDYSETLSILKEIINNAS